MKVKKFVAKSMPEAMKTIRQELGNDAVILNSREIERGGFFGLFTKKNIEVIAAIDTTPVAKRPKPKVNVQSNGVKNPNIAPNSPINQNLLLNEIKQLKTLVSALTNSKDDFREKEYPEPFQQIYDYLIAQDVEKSICLPIMKNLLSKWFEFQGKVEKQEIYKWLKDEIYSLVVNVQDKPVLFTKKYVNIVGPTGVGKTTTIAKIAAHNVLKQHKKVALITTDTYRIAAIDQLKTYAKILNIPLEVAYSIEDFKKAKQQFANYDLVLVDSAGRNFRNQLYVRELQKVIDFNEEMETVLVLALTSKYRDMEEIYEQFSIINIDKFIFTKRDETASFGSMLNMMINHHIKVAYITTGQNVPDDIVVADPNEITNTLLLEVDKDERPS